jgi:transcriptional regulator with XRE-family HTH domain
MRQPTAYDLASLGARLRHCRLRDGLTLRAVGQHLGYSHVSLVRIETGRNGPELSTLVALAHLYSVSLDWLVFGEAVA